MADDKQEQRDPGFRIVDKRKASADDQAEEPATGAGGAKEPSAEAREEAAAAATGAGEEPVDAEGAPPLEPVDAYGLVQFCITLFSNLAWQRMGLVPDQVTRTIERDLEQARVAIDCFEALLKQVEGRAPELELHELRRQLNDLQMNFVRQSAKGT